MTQHTHRGLITATAILLIATLLCGGLMTVLGVTRLNNNQGIDADPNVGLHNSYGWCTELFEQTDGDYLWVGTNRDLGGLVMSMAGITPAAFGAVYDTLGIPAPSADNKGKIYRYSLDAFEPGWELMWENPAINGYRKMMVFNGDLFVFAGITTVLSGYSYSVVYRFGPDFAPGDQPDVVLWEKLPVGAMEYFRAACILDDMLYVGTFDSKIYCTDGQGLTNLTPNNAGTGDKYTGWELAADLTPYLDPPPAIPPTYSVPSYIWDIAAFNGGIYAFTAGQGFRVYKLTPGALGFDVEQIVGDQASAAYPPGLGLTKHFVASPFVSTAFGDDYLYVTTFANGPEFLGQLAKGNVDGAFRDLYCPATIYRFDTNDVWEVVAGDTVGVNVAVDSGGVPVPVVGNSRAGFFPGEKYFPNPSSNQYIWWMAEYQDKLYASTWDVGVFRKSVPLMILSAFIQEYGLANTEALIGPLTDVYDAFQNITDELSATLDGVYTELAVLLADFETDLFDAADIDAARVLIQQLTVDIVGVLTGAAPAVEPALIDELQASLQELLAVIAPTTPEMRAGLARMVSATVASALFYIDKSDPAGFDLFVS
ncbi:MAG: hypothetical protein FWD16_06725, partial [Clostridia bacterium]|nr:hypothetical protein [Clostridia bacterium]